MAIIHRDFLLLGYISEYPYESFFNRLLSVALHS